MVGYNKRIKKQYVQLVKENNICGDANIRDYMDLISKYLNGYRYFCHWYSGKTLYGNQIKVYNREDVVRLIEKYNGIENCGISISTFVDGMPKLLYLPFDFDSTDLRKSFEDAKKLYNTVVDYGYNASFHFSGGKGFHVLIPVVPKFYTKDQLGRTQQFFKNILNLHTTDTQIFRDIRRIIRIPGTYHMNGNLCDIYLNNEDGELLDIDELSPPQYNKFDPTDFKSYNGHSHLYHPYPCIEERIVDEEPRQIIRFSWVIEKLHEGLSEEEIIKEIETFGWVDYNQDTTLYQIRHIRDNGYVHPNCDTFKALGLCKANCPYNREWHGKKIRKQH